MAPKDGSQEEPLPNIAAHELLLPTVTMFPTPPTLDLDPPLSNTPAVDDGEVGSMPAAAREAARRVLSTPGTVHSSGSGEEVKDAQEGGGDEGADDDKGKDGKGGEGEGEEGDTNTNTPQDGDGGAAGGAAGGGGGAGRGGGRHPGGGGSKPELNEAKGEKREWLCTSCSNVNWSFRKACNRCQAPRGGGSQDAVPFLAYPPARGEPMSSASKGTPRSVLTPFSSSAIPRDHRRFEPLGWVQAEFSPVPISDVTRAKSEVGCS